MFIHDDQPQSVYDAFNEFIFSSDRKLFGKLASKLEFVEHVKEVPGDVVELGVFKGSGMMGWLKSLSQVSINHKNVVGFDFFDADSTVESVETSDQQVMESLFKDRGFDPDGYEVKLESILMNAGFGNFELVKGDVTETLEDYLESNPGFRASIVNFDLDVEEPTERCLELLWDRVVPGGVVIFDEYAIKQWTESNAVDRFVKEQFLTLKPTKYFAPSAYVEKW
tara:strand:+ start:344 stop:1015 length:672 start_codon:yes stop_codon:yes gene_type:complete